MEAGFHIKGDDSGGDDVEEDGENEEEEDHGEGTKKPYGHTISVVHPKRKHEHSTITTMTNGDNSKKIIFDFLSPRSVQPIDRAIFTQLQYKKGALPEVQYMFADQFENEERRAVDCHNGQRQT